MRKVNCEKGYLVPRIRVLFGQYEDPKDEVWVTAIFTAEILRLPVVSFATEQSIKKARVSPVHPLTKKPEDSGYQIDSTTFAKNNPALWLPSLNNECFLFLFVCFFSFVV